MNNNINRILFYISIACAATIFMNCNKVVCDKENEILNNCNYRYWDLVYYEKYYGLQGSYRFGINGKCFYLKYFKEDKRRGAFDQEDVENANIWFFINDDSLSIIGRRFLICKYTSDSIILKGVDSSFCILVPSSDQKDAYDFGH